MNEKYYDNKPRNEKGKSHTQNFACQFFRVKDYYNF